MELQNFLDNIVELLEYTDSSKIVAFANFREIEEWSSLFALSIIAMADSEYDIKLTGDEIKRSNTFEDLFLIIKSKKQ